jgi:hypothetical protein
MSELDLETKNIQILIYVIHQADLTPQFRKKSILIGCQRVLLVTGRMDGYSLQVITLHRRSIYTHN